MQPYLMTTTTASASAMETVDKGAGATAVAAGDIRPAPGDDVHEKNSPPPLTSSSSAQHDHFFWTYTEEPHRTRRQAIIKAHPEVCTSLPFLTPSFPSSLSLIRINQRLSSSHLPVSLTHDV